MKIALLGTAALAAVSVSARADNLSDLKAQIETLNARVATLEATPAVPAGYSMVAFSKEGDNHIISIMPTADAPAAAATTISWSGYVRAGIVTTFDSTAAVGSRYSTDIRARAGFAVSAKTDTAVGEVGVNIATVANGGSDNALKYNAGNSALSTDGFNGYWKFTPTMTLTAGVLGTLSKSGYTFDANCTCAYNDPWGAIFGSPTGDPIAMKLGYADGPISFAVQIEDANNNNDNSAFGVSARAKYSMDMISMDLGGGYWGNTYTGGDASWAVSGGVGLKFDPVTLGVSVGAAHYGKGGQSSNPVLPLPGPAPSANYDAWSAGGYANVALGDTSNLELGVTHDFGTAAVDATAGATVMNAGIYYTPVSKLKVGLEGAYQTGGAADKSYTAALVTWFKF